MESTTRPSYSDSKINNLNPDTTYLTRYTTHWRTSKLDKHETEDRQLKVTGWDKEEWNWMMEAEAGENGS